MSKVFVCKSETKPRTYSFIKDAHIFTPTSWMKLSENFQELIKKGVYKKLDYQNWRTINHEKDYTYRVLTFITDFKTYDCKEIILDDYKFNREDKFVFCKENHFFYDANDGSFGSYLKDFYFNPYFGEQEVEDSSFINGSSWNYMYTLYGYYLPPEAKKYDLSWCAIFYKTPWLWSSCDSFLSTTIATAIARLGQDMKTCRIQELDLSKIKKEDNNIYTDTSTGFNMPDTLNKYKINSDGTVKVERECEPSTSAINTNTIVINYSDPTKQVGAYDTLTSTTTNYNYDNITTATKISDLATITPTWSDAISVPSAEKVNEIEKRVKTIEDTIINKKEKEDNKMKMFNFDFGPVKDNDAIRMSPYGLAVKNVNGTYQAYDKNSGEMMDVEVFNFKADNMFFKIPAAIDAIEAGDILIHNRKPMVVFGFSEQGDVIAIDIALGEKKIIMPIRSPFGFDFITKVVCLFDGMTGNVQPDAQHPFGNMLPFLMMGDQSEGFDPMLMCMMMQGQNGFAGMTGNPMMLYFLMKNKDDKDMNDILPFLMMGNMMNK